jgi:hypothetical protein
MAGDNQGCYRNLPTKTLGQKWYEEYSANHPTLHCNRFPHWHDLSEDQKRFYEFKAK